MISPHKSRIAGGGGGTPRSPRTAVPLRGLLLDGIWRCNCPERPPALRLQTKNHGVNHGRWFYTCQKDHQNRCKFFLWASDAEAREKLALLSNSQTETDSSSIQQPQPQPQTPSSSRTISAQKQATGLLTPQTGHRDSDPRKRAAPGQTPPTAGKARMMSEDADEFDWDDTMSTEMNQIFDNSVPPRQPDFGLPARKAARTETVTSPGKRKREDDDEGEHSRSQTLTPGSALGSSKKGSEVFVTPTQGRFRDTIAESPLASTGDLAVEVGRILEGHGLIIPKAAQDELKGLFGRHENKMKGVIRGRDISRAALKKKDEQIARLNERIAGLEAQRELNRSVNGALKKE